MSVSATAQPRPSLFQRMWKSISLVFESRVATVGLVMVLFWIILAIISLFWTPYPENSSLFTQNLPPNATNWLGTDHLGRDILSRLMVGTQVILLKTRLPEMAGSGLLLALAVIFGLISLIAFLIVLTKMFRAAGPIWGILGIFPLISFAWGWVNVKRQELLGTMIVWTLSMVAAILLVLVSPAFAQSTLAAISLPGGVAIWGVAG
jgi:ABC-type dipeptide/oligopeptide/nickel transport system permease subunit